MDEIRAVDLTSGSVSKNLLRFALPVLFANFIQALYGAVDMMIIGWFCDSAVIAGVSIGSQVMQIIYTLAAGVCVGATILIGRYVGSGDQLELNRTISTLFGFTIPMGLGMGALMLIFQNPILRVMQTPAEAFSHAGDYIFYCTIGLLFICAYNIIAAVLRGMGDSRRPLYFVLIACVCNIGLDLLFIGVLGMAAAGAAIATAIAQVISVIISVIYLYRRKFAFSFRIYKKRLGEILACGIPVSMRDVIVHLSFIIITALFNMIGVYASAAAGICSKFDAFAMLPANSFAAAISAICAQCMGAGKTEVAKKSLHIGMLYAAAFSMIFFLWAELFPASIMQMFHAEPQTLEAGVAYLRTFGIDFLLVAFLFCYNGFINGYGKTAFTMIVGIITTIGIRTPLAFFLMQIADGNLTVFGLASPLTSVIGIVLCMLYMRSGRWQPRMDPAKSSPAIS